MRKNNQHIAFDNLLALHGGRLDLQKANQCRNHLDVCEECQNTYEAIQEFNTIELRKPHIQYAEKDLDENLLNITKEYIEKSHKGIYAKILHYYPDKDLLKYSALLTASVLFVFFFSVINQINKTDEYVESPVAQLPVIFTGTEWTDVAIEIYEDDTFAELNNINLNSYTEVIHGGRFNGDTYYISEDYNTTTELGGVSYNPKNSTLYVTNSDPTESLELDSYTQVVGLNFHNLSIPLGSSIISAHLSFTTVSPSLDTLAIYPASYCKTDKDNDRGNNFNIGLSDIGGILKRNKEDTTSLETIRIVGIPSDLKSDLTLNKIAAKKQIRYSEYLPRESTYKERVSHKMVHKEDSLALIALYESTNGANWINSWDVTQCISQWKGISINESGRVTNIDLSDNRLTGHIPKEVGNLSKLEYLLLNNNQLSGRIPPEIDKLGNIKLSDLRDNQLSGVILFERIDNS